MIVRFKRRGTYYYIVAFGKVIQNLRGSASQQVGA
jgi:hypothetical protein